MAREADVPIGSAIESFVSGFVFRNAVRPGPLLPSSERHCGFCDRSDVPADFNTINAILAHNVNV